MTADFFDKKRWLYIVLSQCLAVFIGACMCYAVKIKYATPVWVGKSFYFLVSQDTHIDASTHEIRLDGGAGYLLDYDGRSYVTWSVYLQQADGMAVQAGLNETTQLLKVDVSYLYFKTREEKRRKKDVQGALNSFYGCISVLSQTIEKLEKGLTQNACGGILSNLEKHFSYLHKTYREGYLEFSDTCASIQSMLADVRSKIIYGKDLRYILCGACDAYIRLASKFFL